MAIVPDAVSEQDLDYDEILRRRGANCGDEDFVLCKCPDCGRVYLIEYEVETLYLDPVNLNRRLNLTNYARLSPFTCEECGGPFPESDWFGKKAPQAMQLTWQQLAASPWRWVTSRTRYSAGEQPNRVGEAKRNPP